VTISHSGFGRQRRTLRCGALTGLFLLAAAVAGAQETRPVGPFVVDARGSYARYGQQEDVAFSVGLPPEWLPETGLGIDLGAHVYPFSLGAARVGFGANLHWSNGKDTPTNAAGVPISDPVEVKFVTFAPQLSLNFGKHDGWSYISAGIGVSTRRYQIVGTPLFDDGSTRIPTLNFGGGARWFMKKHLAFSLDLRFYTIRPQETSTRTPLGRTRLIVLNAGVSFR
jgi:hypothetical protein